MNKSLEQDPMSTPSTEQTWIPAPTASTYLSDFGQVFCFHFIHLQYFFLMHYPSKITIQSNQNNEVIPRPHIPQLFHYQARTGLGRKRKMFIKLTWKTCLSVSQWRNATEVHRTCLFNSEITLLNLRKRIVNHLLFWHFSTNWTVLA